MKAKENIKSENIKKGGKGKMLVFAFALSLVFIIIFLTVGYVYVARSYRTRFLPDSMINGINCSNMDVAEVSARLTPSVDDYVIEVKGRDFTTGESGTVLGRITAADINMYYEGITTSVENALAQQNEYKWIFAYLTDKTTNYSVAMTISYEEEKVKNLVQTWDAFQAENMREAQYAYISEYSEKTNSYEVIPRTISTKISLEQAYKCIMDSIHNYKTELDIEAMDCYEEIAKQDEEKLKDTVNTANKWLNASVTYDWNGSTVVLDKEQLREWISIVDNEPVLDTEQIKNFVKKQASQYDTYGKDRHFVTTHGVDLVLPSGYYGWKTDVAGETEALMQLIEQGSTSKREPIYSSKARKKGISDIGDSYVEADMTHQHLYLYSNGELVLETDFVSGDVATDCNTPEGVFGIAYKTTNAILRGRDYVTPVSYWMPYYNNYGMHDATWRDEFGGDIYLTDGSHGCLNLPLDKAEQIYQYMSAGFPVICYFYDVDPLAGQEEPEEYEEDDEDEEE